MKKNQEKKIKKPFFFYLNQPPNHQSTSSTAAPMIACFENLPRFLSAAAGDEDCDTAGETKTVQLEAYGRDFGGMVTSVPAAVFLPSTADEVARAIRIARAKGLALAARGNGHSIHGQAGAAGGLVLDMRALAGPIEFTGGPEEPCAVVPAGALWAEVLEWAVSRYGMAPPSWTDYLGLTVGGTLSNGGVSGQTFRHGPQVVNVAQLEVVTGDGERRLCSPEAGETDLFFAVLGGLGQFGVITRAWIPLVPAPAAVKWIRVVYNDFAVYASDAESLVKRYGPDSFDYVEGFVFVNSDDPVNGYGSVPLDSDRQNFDPNRIPQGSGPLLYCLELGLHCHHGHRVDQRAAEMLKPLRYVEGLEFRAKVPYVEFLSRVNICEAEARANGSWHAPHAWLNIFVSACDIVDFDQEVFRKILRRGVGGPMLVYPMLRSKWDQRMSVSVPDGEIFYLVALLRSARPPPDGPSAEEMMAENHAVVDRCRTAGYDYKIYLPYYRDQSQWALHFGDKGWSRFVDRKARYDPAAILSPGQLIFSPEAPPPPPPHRG